MSSPTLTFTPPMFHASKAGIKDTTRRAVIPSWTATEFDELRTTTPFVQIQERWFYRNRQGIDVSLRSQPHQPGQIKPMVTTWAVDSAADELTPTQIGHILQQDPKFIWFNDGTEKPSWCGKSRPGRFLPKALYSLAPQVEILTVTPEFLLDITEASALREGVESIGSKFGVSNADGDFEHQHVDATGSYLRLWDSINAARDEGQFAAKHNPAVWVITYRVL